MNLDNCPNCGAVFQKNIRNLCDVCYAHMDRALQRCMDHLWKIPNSTSDEVSVSAQVPISVVYTFIKEGRLPKVYARLSYPCECCGAFIRHNRLCSSCSRTFNDAVKQIHSSWNREKTHVYNIRK